MPLSTERRFKCQLCTKTFRYSNDLNRHARSHQNDEGEIEVTTPQKPHLLPTIEQQLSAAKRRGLHDDVLAEDWVRLQPALKKVKPDGGDHLDADGSSGGAVRKPRKLTNFLRAPRKPRGLLEESGEDGAMLADDEAGSWDMGDQLKEAARRAANLFSCEVCNKAFSQQNVLAMHMRSHRANPSPIKAEQNSAPPASTGE